jgi:sialate O-acetylesterase
MMLSLTFDDALPQHLDEVVPTLTDHGLAGTFYTHLAAPTFAQRLDDWRAAARAGHELGNHTIFHPADQRKSWVREGNALDLYSLDRMRMELETANVWLAAIDGQGDRTFAYPCSNPVLGRRGLVKSLLFKCGYEFSRLPGLVDRFRLDIGSTRRSYEDALPELFLSARGGGLARESVIPSLSAWNRYYLYSVAIDDWNLDELITFTERGFERETWVILQFHGVGGGHRLDCRVDVFRRFVAWVATNHASRVKTVREGSRLVWDSRTSATA